jgi:hypothetical protein
VEFAVFREYPESRRRESRVRSALSVAVGGVWQGGGNFPAHDIASDGGGEIGRRGGGRWGTSNA